MGSRINRTRASLAALALIAASCASDGGKPAAPALAPDAGASDARTSGAVDGTPPDTAAAPGHALGVIVIDVQQSFVAGAVNPDMAQVLANTREVLALAGQHQTPLLITFEGSKSAAEGAALPPEVRAAVPDHAQELIKTTFAATGLPAFVSAVQQAGLTHAIVLGAETDVCVLQTVLGLRTLGISVILQRDAVFSSEPNIGPALRRMQQAGVSLAAMDEVRALIAAAQDPPAPAAAAVPILDPPRVAVLLDELSAAAVTASQDPNKAAKLARLRELLLISEWFELPLYATAEAATLPAELSGLITKAIKPAAELAQSSAVTQLAIAGTDATLAQLVAEHGAAREVFLVEDGLLAAGDAAAQPADLELLYAAGAVPITYKSLYYELTKSVSLDEWPAAWVARDPIYYPKTRAPEELPPIVK